MRVKKLQWGGGVGGGEGESLRDLGKSTDHFLIFVSEWTSGVWCARARARVCVCVWRSRACTFVCHVYALADRMFTRAIEAFLLWWSILRTLVVL